MTISEILTATTRTICAGLPTCRVHGEVLHLWDSQRGSRVTLLGGDHSLTVWAPLSSLRGMDAGLSRGQVVEMGHPP